MLLAAAGDLVTAVAQLLAHAAHAMGVAANRLDHAAQVALHGRQATNQRTGFVLAGGLDNRFAQVAMGDAVGNAAGSLQRPHDAQNHPAALEEQQ
ncbi:hypothetical protein D3C86_1847070 [compost metagenome]